MICQRLSNIIAKNKEYLMQIIFVQSEYEEYVSYARYRYEFGIRLWTNTKDMDHFHDLTEVFYSRGRKCREYLTDFVQNATGYELAPFDTDVDFTVGAAFIGVITTKHSYNRDGWICKTFNNIKAIEPLGYYAVEGEEDE